MFTRQPKLEPIADDLTQLYNRFQAAYVSDMDASGTVAVVTSGRVLSSVYPNPYPLWRREGSADVFDVANIRPEDMFLIPAEDAHVIADLRELQSILPVGARLSVRRARGNWLRDVLAIEWKRLGL